MNGDRPQVAPPETQWESSGLMLKQLQVAAGQMYQQVTAPLTARDKSTSAARALLLELLRTMQEFRTLVNNVFLVPALEQAGAANEDNHLLLVRLQDITLEIHDLIERIQAATRTVCPSTKQLQQQRHDQIQKEIDCVMEMFEKLHDSSKLPSVRPPPFATASSVIYVIHALRQAELSQEFHRSLLQAQRQISISSSYSMDNFAYGSTPFHTWLDLIQSAHVNQAIMECQAAKECVQNVTPHSFTVFGSSTGSFVFYAVLMLGIESVGIEILPFLCQVAEGTQSKAQIPAAYCRFICEDMLQSSLSQTKILILTSQCWDPELHDRVLDKLERELPLDSIVIDYKDTLCKSQCFQLVDELHERQVSWNPRQSFFIFKCTRSCILSSHDP